MNQQEETEEIGKRAETGNIVEIEGKTKELSLAKFLDLDEEEAEEIKEAEWDKYGLKVYRADENEYAIGTDEEVNLAMKLCIADSVWAFSPAFIVDQCDLPCELTEVINGFQEEKCEGANDVILALINKCADFDLFVSDAIRTDGRGHFLNGWDRKEYKEGDYFIYRV